MIPARPPSASAPHALIHSVHGIRYQVKDVVRSVAFYTRRLGFTLQHQHPPAFANVSLGDAQILLSDPGASGSRAMPNGQQQESDGWNGVVFKVARYSRPDRGFEKAGLRFRNEMETGAGGRQMQLRIQTEIRSSYSSRFARAFSNSCSDAAAAMLDVVRALVTQEESERRRHQLADVFERAWAERAE